MAKFLNKKEQVYDLKLTTYGHYLLSNGTFKPMYYGFFDDNILYDREYATGTPAGLTMKIRSTHPNSAWDLKTLTITDAVGTAKTFTFLYEDASKDTYAPNGTNSSYIWLGGISAIDDTSTYKYMIAEEIAKSINLAHEEGLLGVGATATTNITVADGVGTDGAAYRNEGFVNLLMSTIGTAGNAGSAYVSSGGTNTPLFIGTTPGKSFGNGTDSYGEAQNEIHERIRDTPHLESIVLFEDPEDYVSQATDTSETYTEYTDRVYSAAGVLDTGASTGEEVGSYTYYATDVNPTTVVPRNNIYKFSNVIGDAFFEGETQSAPAWKVVALDGEISSSATREATLGAGYDVTVPQVNMTLYYKKVVKDASFNFDPDDVRHLINRTPPFADNKVIVLEMDDAMVYTDEINTQILTENFDIEVFEVVDEDDTATMSARNLNRKYFEKKIPQVVNGFMVSAQEEENPTENLTTDSVEYYFDVLVDSEINPKIACKGAEVFNKQSYYVDLDFDCDYEASSASYYDIYGSVTEPEICQS